MRLIIILLNFLCLNLIQFGSCYKILGVFPMVARSHHIVGLSLMKGLAEKGHDVTMITPFEERIQMRNFRIINLPELVNKTKGHFENIFETTTGHKNFVSGFMRIFDMGLNITKFTIEDSNFQALLRSQEKFDVIINEIFINEALLGLGHHFKAPTIGVSTFGASIWTTDLVGSPAPPSFVPNPFLAYSDNMNIKERLINFLFTAFDRIFLENFYLPRQVALYDKTFSNPKPKLLELRRNVSLVLLNSHFSLGYPRPYMPNMIEIGGMHLKHQPKQLPGEIKQFLDSATNGAIYFSMGSNVKSIHLPKDVIEKLLKAFSTLKQKVLFKWEDITLPGKPDNVLISKWFPQDDILAHPNIKLFITHGGLLSATEAVFHGVPVLSLPLFGDQFLNAERSEKAGFGMKLDLKNLNSVDLNTALDELLHNPSYKTRVSKLSEVFRDRPVQAMENAIYWIEYVIKHKGAPHLHSGGQDLTFIEYHNLDVLAIVFGFVFIIFYFITKLVLKFLLSGKRTHKVSTKVKSS